MRPVLVVEFHRLSPGWPCLLGMLNKHELTSGEIRLTSCWLVVLSVRNRPVKGPSDRYRRTRASYTSPRIYHAGSTSMA